jgi:hypothetical protein
MGYLPAVPADNGRAGSSAISGRKWIMQAFSFPRGINFTRDLITTLDGPGFIPDALRSLASEFSKEVRSTSWLLRYVLGRLPKTPDAFIERIEGTPPENRMRLLFRSAEYARPLGRRIMAAFPENRRTYFLHVPKTGGTTANAAMSRSGRFIVTPTLTVMNEDTSLKNIQTYVRNTSILLKKCPDAHFFLVGHPTARELIQHNLVRAGDTVFSMVRDSNDLFESFFNYILDLFERHKEGDLPFAAMAAWYRVLGLAEGEHPSTDELLAMTGKLMTHVMTAAPMCAALGAGTAESVIEMMRKVDGKLFPLRHLDDAMRFVGVQAGAPENTSRRRYRISDFDPGMRRKIAEFMAEDSKLMDILEAGGLHPEHNYYLLDRAKG